MIPAGTAISLKNDFINARLDLPKKYIYLFLYAIFRRSRVMILDWYNDRYHTDEPRLSGIWTYDLDTTISEQAIW